jgi:hypothetical protein
LFGCNVFGGAMAYTVTLEETLLPDLSGPSAIRAHLLRSTGIHRLLPDTSV